MAGPATQANREVTAWLLSGPRTNSFLLGFNLGDVASGTFLILLLHGVFMEKSPIDC